MGVVYEALDKERSERVALKTLPLVEADALARFKNEFRSLADVTHPNLAALYELFSDGDEWFFTMELVAGHDFTQYVRLGPEAIAARATPPEGGISAITMERTYSSPQPLSPAAVSPASLSLSPDDTELLAAQPRGELAEEVVARLRPCLRQLVEAAAALHAAGKLHCDIKPSNTLITAEGHVVLLDFGLATDLAPRQKESSRMIAGTAAYMAPEQAEGGRPLTAAADWYAVGTLLFECLTGRLPFEGPAERVRRAKREKDGPRPSVFASAVPQDLDDLCASLLRVQPDARPTSQQVLAAVGAAASAPAAPAAPPHSAVIVGRGAHLAQLQAAYAAMARGSAITVHVRGQSGAGKSFLVRRFIDSLKPLGAVVLEGRCYEGETVPFKALDSVMDGLGSFLASMRIGDALQLMPRDIHALARIFPVLKRADAVQEAPLRGDEVPDRQELRRRAFTALRELLARIGDRHPLVIAIDDMQWGDADSAALLAEILRPPDAPRLLLAALYRSEHATTSPLLKDFVAVQAAPGLKSRDIVVDSLDHEQAVELAALLLAHHGLRDRELAERVARESRGVPYFVHELAQHLGEGGAAAGDALTLDDVLSARVARLSTESRRLLETIAVSASPLSQGDAVRASGLPADPRRALAALRVGHLVKTTGPGDRDLVEAYHDRIRELVTTRLEAGERRACHLRLATTLLGSERADAEAIGTHFEGAGETAEAALHYEAAGQRAAEALAFERAARLFRRSLSLRVPQGDEHSELRGRLADALANAGHGLEAAREYERASGDLDFERTFELRQRAAWQYCITGHLDEGRAVLRQLLRHVGRRMPTTRAATIAQLLMNRARLKLRGIGYRRRAAADVPPALLRRVDVTWVASAGLSMFDTVAGTAFQSRNVIDALDAGEPTRVVRALAWEAVVTGNAGPAARPRSLELLQAATTLAEDTGGLYARAMCLLGRGVTEFVLGNWVPACALLDQAADSFRSHCTGVTWELNTANSFSLWGLVHRGEFALMKSRSAALWKEADERGDRNAATNMQSFMSSHARLMADDPFAARRDVDEALSRFSVEGYQLQHVNALWMRSYIDFYEGSGAEVAPRLEKEKGKLRGSFLLRSLVIRSFINYLTARGALERRGTDSVAGLRAAERAAAALEGEGAAFASALASVVRAAIAARRGSRQDAAATLERAETALEAAGMAGFAAAARYRRGQWQGGPQGEALVASATAWMRSQEITNPARMADLHVPQA